MLLLLLLLLLWTDSFCHLARHRLSKWLSGGIEKKLSHV
jgi:hypothetical protein